MWATTSIAAVGTFVVCLPREAWQARGKREQRRVAREVGGRARGRLSEASCIAAGQPRAGEPKGENLLGVHRGKANRAQSAPANYGRG